MARVRYAEGPTDPIYSYPGCDWVGCEELAKEEVESVPVSFGDPDRFRRRLCKTHFEALPRDRDEATARGLPDFFHWERTLPPPVPVSGTGWMLVQKPEDWPKRPVTCSCGQ